MQCKRRSVIESSLNSMASVSFPDVPRFEMLSRLGEGGMGVVYEAYDREYDAKVALKVLRFSDHGERIQKFKQEFRLLQEIRHPNLARFLELMEHDGRWFFTMELVNGTHFLDWIRPGVENEDSTSNEMSELPTERILVEAIQRSELVAKLSRGKASTLDKERLLDGFVQLARGLLFLHLANKVHRDIKPSNIIVDEDGRVVVLDFGLSSDIGEVQSGEFMGTPVYMAPELTELGVAGSASDWYSVGVMLFEALTGQLPVSGSMEEILKSPAMKVAPAPSLVDPAVDEMWDFLCTCLMHYDPDKRPGGKEILSLLGSEQAPSPQGPRELDEQTLVGRAHELAQLHHAYDGLSVQRSSTVFVYGESGVGKSELMGVFGRSIEHEALLLSGQCYQKESVPYKAVDGIVDALALHLRSIELSEVTPLLSDDSSLLVRAFPVLRQVGAFRKAASVDIKHLHPMELRSRVFQALRNLLSRVAKQSPLVLLIDDLQWADQDSLDLLGALLEQPQEPRLMLVASIRTPADSKLRAQLEQRLEAIVFAIDRIRIGVLDPESAEELATRVCKEQGITNVTPGEIAKEADGHPFFIEVLLRYCYTQGRHGGHSLNEALARHIEELSEPDRLLLEVLSLAEKPLPRVVAAQATGQTLEQLRDSVDSLQAEKLVRGDGIRNTDTIALYHSRVREVAANLNPHTKKFYYRALATALEDGHSNDLETLARYWTFAEEFSKAAIHYELAADDAVRTTAYKRASRLYREVIAAQADKPECRLWEKLANTLVSAGRGSDAADAFEEASRLSDSERVYTFRQLAAEQLLRCGRIDDGIAAMAPVLESYKQALPKKRGAVLRMFLRERLLLRWKSWFPTSNRHGEVDSWRLEQMDTLWGATIGLFNVDQLLALGLHTKHLRLALSSGDAIRISRGYALEAASLAAIGQPRAEIEKLLQKAETLAAQTADKGAIAWVATTKIAASYLQGDWLRCRRDIPGCVVQLAATNGGVAWELGSLAMIQQSVSVFLGDIDSLTVQVKRNLKNAQGNGDLYTELGACSGLSNITFLFEDKPDEARTLASDAISRWSQSGVHLQHFLDLYAQTQIDLYEGKAQEAWGRIEWKWAELKASGLMRVGLNRVLLLDLRARVAIACFWQSMDAKEKKVLRREARNASSSLIKESMIWAQALGVFLSAQLEEGSGRDKFAEATTLFSNCGMRIHMNIAEALASGGASTAVDQLSDESIANPTKALRLYVALGN